VSAALTLGLVLRAVLSADPGGVQQVGVQQVGVQQVGVRPVGTPETEDSQAEIEAAAQLGRAEPIQGLLGIFLQFRGGNPVDRGPQQTATDLEIDPVVGVRMPWLGRGIALRYEPRIFIAPGPVEKHVAYLHRLFLGMDVEASSRLRVYATVRGALGEYDFSPLSTVVPNNGATGQPPNPNGTGVNTLPSTVGLPDQRYVNVIDADGSLGFVYSVSPRLRWNLSGGFGVSGGNDRDSQAVLPRGRGPTATTGLRWDASPLDSVGPALSGSYTEFTTGSKTAIGDLVAAWTRSWSRTVTTDLFAGVGFTWDRMAPPSAGQPQPVTRTWAPSVGFGIRRSTQRPTGGTVISLAVVYTPQTDALGNGVYQQVNAVVRGSLAPNEHLSFDLTAAGSDQVNGPQRDVRLEGRISWAPVREVYLATGVRTAWLEGSTLLGPAGFGWQAFVSISASTGDTGLGGRR
jgi:hypothetical protein